MKPTYSFSLISILLFLLSCDSPSNQQGGGQYETEYQTTNDITYECNLVKERIEEFKILAAEHEQSAQNCKPGSISKMSYLNLAQQALNQVEEDETWLYNNCN